MDDPLGSFVPLCQVSPSQEPALSPSAASESGILRLEPTGICMVSPPDSPDNFETPPEEAVPGASSEERWFGCDGESVVVGAGCEKMLDLGFPETGMAQKPVADGKTVDLGRDADLGFSETGMAQKRFAELESDVAHEGRKLVQVEISEGELTEFLNWKRKLAFRKKILDERPAKQQCVHEKRSNLDSPRPGAGDRNVEERSIDDMGSRSTMGYLKSNNSIQGLESPQSLQVKAKDQTTSKSKECTQVLSLDSEVNSLVSDAGMVKNSLELNDCTQVVRLVSGGKGLIADVGMSNNGLGSNDCTEVVNLGCVGKGLAADSGVSNTGLDLKDCTEVERLNSGGKGLVADAGMTKNGVESNDCTEVIRLDSGGKGLVVGMTNNGVELNDCTQVVRSDSGGKERCSDQGIDKNGLESNDTTQLVMLDSEDNDLVSDEGIVNLGSGSTEEIVMDSDGEDLVCHEAIAKNGLASNDSTEVVEGEDMVSGASVVKKTPTLNDGAGEGVKRPTLNDGVEEGVDNDPNAGKAEKLQCKGEGMVSDSSRRAKVARVLPMSLNAAAKEGDSTKDLTDLLLYALKKLPNTNPDPRFENLSLVEIAKIRGVTFPQPSWWGEEE